MASQDAPIPSRYRHVQKQMSAIDSSRRVKVRAEQQGTLDLASTNRVSFKFPNQDFLDCSSVTLIGSIAVQGTDAVATAYATLQPSVGSGTYDDLSIILNRIYTTLGAVRVDDQVRNNIYTSIIRNLRFNPATTQLFAQPYCNAGLYQAGKTSTTFYDFRIPLQFSSQNLFSGFGANDQILLPLYAMPQFQTEIYFENPNRVVSVVNGVGTGPFVVNYQLQNLQLDCQYVESKALRQQMAQRGWQCSFTSQLSQASNINAGTGGQISINLPSAYRQLMMLMTTIRKTADETDVENAERNALTSDELSYIQRANVVLNSTRRYIEDLDQPALERERKWIHTESEQSTFFHTTTALLNTTHNQQVMLCGRDYPSISFLTGINSAEQVGSLIQELTFTNTITSDSMAYAFLVYVTSLTIAPNGNFEISR